MQVMGLELSWVILVQSLAFWLSLPRGRLLLAPLRLASREGRECCEARVSVKHACLAARVTRRRGVEVTTAPGAHVSQTPGLVGSFTGW
jgi:hypothetical protein